VTQEGYVTEIARLFPRQGQWNEDCYFALPETNLIVELADGRLIMNPPPEPYHQDVPHNLLRLLDQHVISNQLGRVYYSPISLRLWEGNIREPDLLFLSNECLGQIGQKIIDAPVDWVAEIISPGSREIDEVDKLREYAQAGIPEYWLLDPEAKTIRVYGLPEGQSTYTLVGAYGVGQVAKSEIIRGFQVEVELAKSSLPNYLIRTFRTIAANPVSQ